MASQHGEHYLACALIRHRFGHLASIVAQALLKCPKQSLRQLTTLTTLPITTVASVLISLMQHDLAVCQCAFDSSRPLKTINVRRSTTTGAALLFPPYSTELLVAASDPIGTSSSAPPSRYSEIDMDLASTLFGVSQQVLPESRLITTLPPPDDTQYFYSLDLYMIRSLSRTPFYSAFVNEFFPTPDCKWIIDEFVLRGKMTIYQVVEHAIDRFLSTQDEHLRLKQKLEDGTDSPEPTFAALTAFSDLQLNEVSAWMFNHIRLTLSRPELAPVAVPAAAKASLLERIEAIELARFQTALERVLPAVQHILSANLLIPSPGFIDFASLTDPSCAPTAPSGLVTAAEQQTLTGGLGAVKRKLLQENAATSLFGAAVNSVSLTHSDPDDLFDPPEMTRARFAAPRTGSIGGLSSTTDAASQFVRLPSPSTQSLSIEAQPFILHHDRFTLLFRGEIFADFVSRTICPTSGLIVGAISFYAALQPIPSVAAMFSVQSLIPIFERYVAIRHKLLSARQVQSISVEMSVTTAGQPSSPRLGPTSTTSLSQTLSTLPGTNRHAMSNASSTSNSADSASNLVIFPSIPHALVHYHAVPASADVLSQTLFKLLHTMPQSTAPLSERSPAARPMLVLLPHSKLYIIHAQSLAQRIRITYTSNHLLSKYGPDAKRIYGVLMDHGRIEDKQVSDLGLVPKKHTKELLHMLSIEGILDSLEVPTTTDRFAAAKSFFLWSVNDSQSIRTLLRVFYKSYASILLRMDHERAQHTEHIDKVLVAKHFEVREDDILGGKAHQILYARMMHVLSGTMKAILMFKDLAPP